MQVLQYCSIDLLSLAKRYRSSLHDAITDYIAIVQRSPQSPKDKLMRAGGSAKASCTPLTAKL